MRFFFLEKQLHVFKRTNIRTNIMIRRELLELLYMPEFYMPICHFVDRDHKVFHSFRDLTSSLKSQLNLQSAI